MISKKLSYCIACSGGPDSMALLDIYRKKGYLLHVAHVNYHKRDTADRDEKIVRDYCDAYDIPFHIHDYKSINKGNFQADARMYRYHFFQEVCDQYRLAGVMVGHQEDDFIETFLMQKEKGLGVKYYGLVDQCELYGVQVYRPLLYKTKKQLLKYCLKNHVPFGIDESNLTNHYSRNQIRHEQVEKMSKSDRAKIIQEAKELNIIQFAREIAACRFLKQSNCFDYDDFIKFSDLEMLIRLILGFDISKKEMSEIIRQFKNNNKIVYLKNNHYLVKEYDKVNYFEKPKDYAFQIEKIEDIEFDYFVVSNKGDSDFYGCTVKPSDFPITIRNFKEGDYISMRYGTKKINRFFIDHKIALWKRLTWPIVTNCNGEVILVPQIGSDLSHYSIKNNLYVMLK